MIYTYGHMESYNLGLSRESIMYKLGYQDRHIYPDGSVAVYHGGAVWKTPQEAQDYICSKPHYIENPEDWAVYILDACWDTDVYYIAGDPYFRLKVDRPILGRF